MRGPLGKGTVEWTGRLAFTLYRLPCVKQITRGKLLCTTLQLCLPLNSLGLEILLWGSFLWFPCWGEPQTWKRPASAWLDLLAGWVPLCHRHHLSLRGLSPVELLSCFPAALCLCWDGWECCTWPYLGDFFPPSLGRWEILFIDLSEIFPNLFFPKSQGKR